MANIIRIASLCLVSLMAAGCGPARPATFGELLSQADEASDDGEYVQAIKLLEKALESRPDDEGALERYTRALHDQAMELIGERKAAEGLAHCEKAKEAHRKLRKLHEGKPGLAGFDEVEKEFLKDLIYDEACAAALTGDSKRAMKCLQEAYETGFTDSGHIEWDSDLASLRSLPEFKAFLAKAKREHPPEPESE